jgi:hypothetical protein
MNPSWLPGKTKNKVLGSILPLATLYTSVSIKTTKSKHLGDLTIAKSGTRAFRAAQNNKIENELRLIKENNFLAVQVNLMGGGGGGKGGFF